MFCIRYNKGYLINTKPFSAIKKKRAGWPPYKGVLRGGQNSTPQSLAPVSLFAPATIDRHGIMLFVFDNG